MKSLENLQMEVLEIRFSSKLCLFNTRLHTEVLSLGHSGISVEMNPLQY